MTGRGPGSGGWLLGTACLLATAAANPAARAQPAADGGAEPPGASLPLAVPAGLRVSLTLADAEGTPIGRAPVGTAFRLNLRFSDALGAQATGLAPAAWLRRPGPGRPVCQEAARAFRVTGRISPDDVRLAGLFVLAMDAEARLAVIDPGRPTGTGTIAALSPLGETPGALVVHEGVGAAFASRPVHGDVVRVVLPSGRPAVVARELGRPVALLPAPGGRLWVGDDAGGRALLLAQDGHILAAPALSPGPVRLVAAGPARLVVAGVDGAALMLDRATGHTIAVFPAGSATDAFVATADALVAADPAGRLVRRWADRPQAAEPFDVPGQIRSLAVGADGRWLVAATEDPASGPGVSVLDLARGRRVHGFASPEPVDEAVVAGHAVFLTWRSRPVVTVVDLAALGASGAGSGDAAVRDVRLLEDAAVVPETRTGPMMTALDPLPAVAVVRPGSRAMATVMAGGGLSSAPMSVVPLKGDPPRQLAAFARSLVETAPGVFEASAQLPRGGAWELVATTGVGGTTACLPVPAAADAEAAAQPGLSVELEPVAVGEAGARVIDLVARIASAPVHPSIRLVLAALDGGWTRVVDARAGADGRYRSRVEWPWAGGFSVAVVGPPHGVAPAVVRVAP